MKKILGSPIGLGEVNLTVDNRVRRRIKEYFGNVDDNSFETTITPVAPDGKKQKIAVIADETYKDKVFILRINDVTIYFKPITKVGNKLEAEPYEIRDWDKLKDIAATTIMYAKLPTTDIEKKAAEEWKEDKDETQEITANTTADTTQSTIDKENSEDNKEQLCNNRPKSDCHEWNDTKKVCEQVLDKGGCVEDDFELCCTSQECKNNKKKWYTENVIGEVIKALTIIGVIVAIIDFFAFFNYQHHYGLRLGNFLLTFINFVGKKFGNEIIKPDGNYGFTYNDEDVLTRDIVKETGWFFVITSKILGIFLGLRVLISIFYKIGLINPFKECTFDDEEEEEEEEKDNSCPIGKTKKTCADGTRKCRPICSKNKKFSTARCKCVPK